MTSSRKVTVRELGGEIWAESFKHVDESEIDWRVKSRLIDMVMGVLARHVGDLIENDGDLPVTPL